MRAIRAGTVLWQRALRRLVGLCGVPAALALGGCLVLVAGAGAQELARGTQVRAAGFYESRNGRERLVAVVLVPIKEEEPKTFANAGFTRKSLGTRTVGEFAPTVQGMKRAALTEKGRILAMLFTLSTPDGDYARIVSYLLGGSQLVVDDPANLKGSMGMGDGSSGGGGDGGGGGGGSSGH